MFITKASVRRGPGGKTSLLRVSLEDAFSDPSGFDPLSSLFTSNFYDSPRLCVNTALIQNDFNPLVK